MNILVVRTDKLGDFITALPTMYALKKQNPQNTIIACIAPMNEALAKECSFIDAIIIDTPESSVFTLMQKIKEHKIDASVTLFSNTRVAFAQFLARIPIRIAPATKIAQIFYNRRIQQKRSEVKMSEFEYNLALSQALFPDISLTFPQPLLAFDDAASLYINFCQKNNISKEVVAFHVGFGGSSDANWNLDEYEILIRAVLEQEKYQVVLTFGPDEKNLYEAMQKRFKEEKVIFYLSVDGLVHFAKLISQFRLFVSTSTGTYHVASLVGTPTMTFFADSLFASASRWKGIGDEKIQRNFMIPHSVSERRKLFKTIKESILQA